MTEIEAIYQAGVFKPLGQVGLPDNQRVRLSIEPVANNPFAAWLEEVQRLQQQIVQSRGYYPDSTPDLAADRARDE